MAELSDNKNNLLKSYLKYMYSASLVLYIFCYGNHNKYEYSSKIDAVHIILINVFKDGLLKCLWNYCQETYISMVVNIIFTCITNCFTLLKFSKYNKNTF